MVALDLICSKVCVALVAFINSNQSQSGQRDTGGIEMWTAVLKTAVPLIGCARADMRKMVDVSSWGSAKMFSTMYINEY